MTPSSSFDSFNPLPPRVVGIEYGIFETPSTPVAPFQQTVPATYALYTSNNEGPTSSIGAPGDWFIMNTLNSIVVYQNINNVWTAFTTIVASSQQTDLTNIYNQLSTLNYSNVTITAELYTQAGTIASNYSALSYEYTYLSAQVYSNTAQIFNEENVRASADYSLAYSITTIGAELGTFQAQLYTESQTRANADGALAMTISTFEASFGRTTAALSTAVTGLVASVSYINGELSSSSYSFTNLSSQVYTNLALLNTEILTRATENTALSTSLSALTAVTTYNYNTLSAEVTSESVARTNQYNSIAYTVNSVYASIQSSLGTISASVTTESAARATADGYLSGMYTLTVSAGNVVTGMTITSASGPGSTISSVIFNAANFKIYNGISAGVAPFTVSGGVVQITAEAVGSLVVNSSLGMSYVSDNGVFTIAGGSAAGNIHGAQIDLSGNGSAAPGDINIQAGNDTGIGNGTIYMRTGLAYLPGNRGLDRLVIQNNGQINTGGDVYLGGASAAEQRIYDFNNNQILRARYATTPTTLANVITILQYHGLSN